MIILGTNSIKGGFEVSNSLRVNDGDSQYLSITPGSAGNTKLWTWSCWFKKCPTGADLGLFGQYIDANNYFRIKFRDDDRLQVDQYTSGSHAASAGFNFILTQQLRDVSAWYHLVVAYDSAQGTDSNRVKIYINGTRVTAFNTETYPNQNVVTTLPVDGTPIELGRTTDSQFFNGYFAEVVLVDGSALAPTSFGEFDEDSPTIWKPINVSGLTFGTNGFYLDFEASANLGNDANGGTDLTEVNIAATDQSTDTCTNNFCTLNALTTRGSSGNTLAEGNLQYSAVAGAGDSSVFGTIGIPPGMKVYFEVKLVQNTAQNSIGIHNLYDGGDGDFVKGGSETGTYSFKTRGASSVTQYFNNGNANNHSVNNAANDTILGVAIDNENGQIHYSLDGTFINSSDPTDNDPVALVTGFGGSTEQYIHTSLDTSGGTEPINQFNFGSPIYSESGGESDANGHGNFNQAVPSGYFALNTKNLAEHG